MRTSAKAILPVIDVSGLRSGQLARKGAVAAEIRAASADKGFFYITNHGISPQLIGEVFAQAKLFFSLPDGAKMQLHKRNSKANRGYEPLGGQRLEPGTPPDLKESLFIGEDLAPSDPRVLGGVFGCGPNQWPDLPGFRAVANAYFAEMHELGGIMYRGLALSLGVDESYFAEFYTRPMNILRFIHYPAQPADPLPDQKGCGAHTDFGGLTLLLQDRVGGLQVWDEGAGWIDAAPIDGTLVVNLGDFVARWTNNRYRSTLHRVVNGSGRERYSIPFFSNGNPNFEVSCIPTCLDIGEVPRFPATTIAKHFTALYQRTYLQQTDVGG